MFAGSLQGVTQTLSLAIYEQFDLDFDVALAISALLILVSGVVLLAVKLMPDGAPGPVLSPSSHFVASAELTVERGRDARARRPVGRWEDDDASGRRRAAAAADGARHARRRACCSTPSGASTVPPERRAASATCSRTTRSSRTCTSRQRAVRRGATRVDELLERFRIGASRSRACRASSPAASGSASRSPARSRATRRCCSSTSRCPPSMRTRESAVRAELRTLLRRAALPTLLVTHDFEDAATLADRVGVLIEGRILQTGTPQELVSSTGRPVRRQPQRRDAPAGSRDGPRDGLTEVVLDERRHRVDADEAAGPVSVVVHPWDVSLGAAGRTTRPEPPHARPCPRSPRSGTACACGSGPVVAEITAASAERLELRPGLVVTASLQGDRRRGSSRPRPSASA